MTLPSSLGSSPSIGSADDAGGVDASIEDPARRLPDHVVHHDGGAGPAEADGQSRYAGCFPCRVNEDEIEGLDALSASAGSVSSAAPTRIPLGGRARRRPRSRGPRSACLGRYSHVTSRPSSGSPWAIQMVLKPARVPIPGRGGRRRLDQQFEQFAGVRGHFDRRHAASRAVVRRAAAGWSGGRRRRRGSPRRRPSGRWAVLNMAPSLPAAALPGGRLRRSGILASAAGCRRSSPRALSSRSTFR